MPDENEDSIKRGNVRYESTSDGDVRIIVQQDSPQSNGNDVGSHPLENDLRGVAPTKKSKNRPPRGHTRNLSAHFQDATKLSEGGHDSTVENFPLQEASSGHHPLSTSTEKEASGRGVIAATPSARYQSGMYPAQQASPSVGQKHRRVFSGGGTNPSVAHRRINSGGNTAVVGRADYRQSTIVSSSYRTSPSTSMQKSAGVSGHRRENSAGLEMLSAAAKFTKGELAEAAGVLPPQLPPPQHQQPGRKQYNMSPTSHVSSIGSDSPSQYYARVGWADKRNSTQYPPPSHHYYYQPPQPHYPDPRVYPVQYPHHMAPSVHNVPGYRGNQAAGRRENHIDGIRMPSSPPLSSSMARHQPQQPPRRYGSSDSAGKVDTDERLFANQQRQMLPSRGVGATAASQTYVTAISVGDSSRAMRPSVRYREQSAGSASTLADSGHHRKMSSFSNLSFLDNDPLHVPTGIDQGGVSSGSSARQPPTPNFLRQSLDDGDRLLQQLSAPAPPPGPPNRPPAARADSRVGQVSGGSVSNSGPPTAAAAVKTSTKKHMSGGTSKRVRRKCTMAGCTNRVVQGGLCIAHGAKRKQCAHPGCNKNVKKAGLCSTHGPARKRCDVDGCTKVAVQGGRCISHGAKKKLCSLESCEKQAILAGMCKKHHDQHNGVPPIATGGRKVSSGGTKKGTGSTNQCVVIDEQPRSREQRRRTNPGHQRGLSIFTDMSAVDTIIRGDEDLVSAEPSASVPYMVSISSEDRGTTDSCEDRAQEERQQGMKKPTHQRGLSLFTDEAVAESIIRNPDITDTSF